MMMTRVDDLRIVIMTIVTFGDADCPVGALLGGGDLRAGGSGCCADPAGEEEVTGSSTLRSIE